MLDNSNFIGEKGIKGTKSLGACVHAQLCPVLCDPMNCP